MEDDVKPFDRRKLKGFKIIEPTAEQKQKNLEFYNQLQGAFDTGLKEGFNAGIEAALGALPDIFDRAEEHPYESGWTNALDQAKSNIEMLKSNHAHQAQKETPQSGQN